MAKKKKMKTQPDLTLPIFELRISLLHITPAIWRRVQVHDCSLHDLHQIIQAAMGWDDMHMHVFVIGDEEYGDFKRDVFDNDSRSTRLSQILEAGYTSFRYIYDFGDDWEHRIDIERTLRIAEGVRYPLCVTGARARPPEDSGGPFSYPDFLKRLKDPNHEEHDDTVEWVGEDFDPAKFDLDEANRELHRLRRWLGRTRVKTIPKAAFAKGQLVQVKHGVVHDLYPDIPLGGWVGRITRVASLIPIGYAVHWTKPTLDQLPEIFRKRCRRDEEETYRYWIDDEDLIEPAGSESPTAMEQPTNIVSRPLSMDDADDRIRMVFGLTSDDPLPGSKITNQQRFLEHLRGHLSLPFQAAVYGDGWKSEQDTKLDVEILGFADPPIDIVSGIVVKAREGEHEFQTALSNIRADEGHANFDFIQDYIDWLWESGLSDEEDEESPPSRFPIGTVAYYGPDDKTTTKIVAGVFEYEGAEPIIKRWVATDVTTNPKVQKKIDEFFRKHGVREVGMSAGNMGCPHEEGPDFPIGGDCPFCPWWKGKQGSGAKE